MPRPIRIVRWVLFKLKLLQIFSWAFFLLPYNSLDFENILFVENSPINTPQSCTFCDVSKEAGFDVVWEDATFIAFKDHKPAARHHFQVSPKKHIESVKLLRKSDIALVKSMETIGHELLDRVTVPSSMRRMGFHIPPFNSVNHLHLHIQGLPYNSTGRAAKYPVVSGYGEYHKGASWFVEVNQVLRILERDSNATNLYNSAIF